MTADPLSPDALAELEARHICGLGAAHGVCCGVPVERDVLLRLVAQLRYWMTCSNCGQPMDAPGNCSVALREWQQGQELMLSETLTRAETAEAQVRTITAERDAAREEAAHWKAAGTELSREFHAAIGEQEYAGTRADWRARAQAAEAERDRLDWAARKFQAALAEVMQERDRLLAAQGNALAFDALAEANILRCEASDGFNHAIASWEPSRWTNALAGETGEACNYAKKLDRLAEGVRGNKGDDQNADMVRLKMGLELADVVIYADLAARRIGFRLADLVRQKWNEKSSEIGYGGRI